MLPFASYTNCSLADLLSHLTDMADAPRVLTVCERLMILLCIILIHFSQMADAACVHAVCERLLTCLAWRRLLHHLLETGNTINAHKGVAAAGFRLSSLEKFVDMRCVKSGCLDMCGCSLARCEQTLGACLHSFQPATHLHELAGHTTSGCHCWTLWLRLSSLMCPDTLMM